MLLYLVTKNHSFSDGNKRIAATLFLWFLNNNGILYRPDGTKRLADNTLVAHTLMIAEPTHEQEQSQTCLNRVRRRKTKSKQDRGKGCHGKGGGELDQSKELTMIKIWASRSSANSSLSPTTLLLPS